MNIRNYLLVIMAMLLLIAGMGLVSAVAPANVTVTMTAPTAITTSDSYLAWSCTAVVMNDSNWTVSRLDIFSNYTGTWATRDADTSWVNNTAQTGTVTIGEYSDGQYDFGCVATTNSSEYNYSSNVTVTVDRNTGYSFVPGQTSASSGTTFDTGVEPPFLQTDNGKLAIVIVVLLLVILALYFIIKKK